LITGKSTIFELLLEMLKNVKISYFCKMIKDI
jgi:hypothetical protein